MTENGSVRVGRWKCGQCTAIFDSKKALSVDSRHQHAYGTVLKRFVFGDECLVCGKIFFAHPRLLAHVRSSVHCRSSYVDCFPPAADEVVESAQEADSAYAQELRSKGWLPTKAFVPPIRVSGPLLPAGGTDWQ